MLQYKVTWHYRSDGANQVERLCRFEGWYLFGFIPLWVVQKTYVGMGGGVLNVED